MIVVFLFFIAIYCLLQRASLVKYVMFVGLLCYLMFKVYPSRQLKQKKKSLEMLIQEYIQKYRPSLDDRELEFYIKKIFEGQELNREEIIEEFIEYLYPVHLQLAPLSVTKEIEEELNVLYKIIKESIRE